MACFFLLGSYYCYDIPAVIETQLEEQFKIEPTTWSLLYSVYSMPNMVMPLVGGVILDTIGVRFGLMFFATVLCLGQAIVMIGGYKEEFVTIVVGRCVFGIGAEPMFVAKTALIALWFKGKELAFSFGVILSVTRLGSVWNSNVTPGYYQDYGLGFALAFGLMICVFSFFNGIGMCVLDAYAMSKDPD